ncbi:hypothetical protein [Henriciella litoralis]|uniref:hypothetical protein n=1 Tax=Henriciella litoralis TaxID=568102 RepID=UPI000A04150A|nr:hypothetical protein [Henriciella litoralis]
MTDLRKDTVEKCVRAALTLAAKKPWPELTLAEVTKEAGVSLEDVRGLMDKNKLADEIDSFFDRAMSEGAFDDDESPRTRLFDVIMMRFEAMEPHREALLSLMEWRKTQPLRLISLIAAREDTANWALACTGLDKTEDLPKPVRTASVGWAITRAERAWRKEDSADLSRTMASLDGELRKMEEREGWLNKWRGKLSGKSEDETAERSPTDDTEPTTEQQPS